MTLNGQNKRRSALPIACGVALLAAFLLPFALWGNPYPDEALRYWTLGLFAVVATSLLSGALRLDRIVDRVDELVSRPSPVVFATGLAVATLAVCLFVSAWVFQHGPSTSDEIAQLWHARILLNGRWSLPPDAHREFFALDDVIDRPRWYSQFPVGGPMALALGAIVGSPWLVNPICAAIAIAFGYDFARRAFGERQGRVIAIVLASSPMFMMMSGTWMNHVPVLMFVTLALAGLARWAAAPSFRAGAAWAAVIGIAIGAIATIRPYDAILVAIAIGTFQAWTIGRSAPTRLREIGVQALAGAMAVSPLLIANARTTGRALLLGYEVLWGRGHGVGFHVDPYGNAHTLAQGADYVLSYVGELNLHASAWPIPAMLIIALGLMAARWLTRWDVLALGLLGVQVAGYGAYWYRGEFLGPRFLFTALPAVAILTVRSLVMLGQRGGEGWRRAVRVGAFTCMVIAWAAVPASVSAWGLARQARAQRTSLKTDVAAAARATNVHHAVVFVRESFGGRLTRRLWGIGIDRASAAALLATRDACGLLSAVATAEAHPAMPLAEMAALFRAAPRFRPGPDNVATGDRAIHVESPANVTAECAAELDMDRNSFLSPFGPALLLEPIDAEGRIDGDIVYVADLGAHNEALRGRFGDRQWYRLESTPPASGPATAVLVPYDGAR